MHAQEFIEISSLMGEKLFLSRNKKATPKPRLAKGLWKPEEDRFLSDTYDFLCLSIHSATKSAAQYFNRMLTNLVQQYGLKRWSHIASMLKGRIGKQCRERWYNHLRPDIKKDTWTEEEEKALIAAHADLGNRWAEIAKRIPGRSENSIKNHWNTTKRRQLSKRRCRRIDEDGQRSTLLQEYISKTTTLGIKEIQGTEGNCMSEGPLSSLSVQDFEAWRESHEIGERHTSCGNVDLSLLFNWTTAPTLSSGSLWEEQNPSVSFEMEYGEVKREMDLIELVSSSIKMNNW